MFYSLRFHRRAALRCTDATRGNTLLTKSSDYGGALTTLQRAIFLIVFLLYDDVIRAHDESRPSF
ncbi:hypothetical protein EYF80_058846 [Liparis tanakae]|uniref:Uncharacterized protein n=1 Tax=Liparis tanakae TaxID=230148 RepID=A0A4Z2ERK7_9TELE|nr:hypothetical protein EYF80_058846 [Liparis tanakae]